MNTQEQKQPQFTTSPVQASKVNEPEFVDVPGLFQMFAIKRSLAYALISDGKIKSVSLRRRGQTKGKRLFSVASVRDYLAEQMESQK